VRYSAEEKMLHFLIASELREALPGWFSRGLQDIRKQDSLAKTVHGSGLLLALGLGLTGLIIFLEISPEGSIGALGHEALEVHELLGTLLWIFIIAHMAMAIYHQLLGHKVLQYIFWAEKQ